MHLPQLHWYAVRTTCYCAVPPLVRFYFVAELKKTVAKYVYSRGGLLRDQCPTYTHTYTRRWRTPKHKVRHALSVTSSLCCVPVIRWSLFTFCSSFCTTCDTQLSYRTTILWSGLLLFLSGLDEYCTILCRVFISVHNHYEQSPFAVFR